MAPAKPGVLGRSYQRASITARTIFELSILAVAVHIVAIVYYRYFLATAPYYNFNTNAIFLIATAWFLVSSYPFIDQIREIYEPSNCRRRFHWRATGCSFNVKIYKPEESYNYEFESIYLSSYARRICLLVTSLHVARFWWISVRWLGFPIIEVLNSPLLADLGLNAPFLILRALFICVFNYIWSGIGLVAVYWLLEYIWVVMGVVLEDFYDDIHREIERELKHTTSSLKLPNGCLWKIRAAYVLEEEICSAIA